MNTSKNDLKIFTVSLSIYYLEQCTVSTKRSLGRLVVRVSFQQGDHQFIGDNDVNAVDVDDDDDDDDDGGGGGGGGGSGGVVDDDDGGGGGGGVVDDDDDDDGGGGGGGGG